MGVLVMQRDGSLVNKGGWSLGVSRDGYFVNVQWVMMRKAELIAMPSSHYMLWVCQHNAMRSWLLMEAIAMQVCQGR